MKLLIFILISLFFSNISYAKFDKNLFLELKYRKLKPNVVTIDNETITIQVKESASPLFYKVNKQLKQINVEGEVLIKKPLTDLKNDSYFQLGVIYEGKEKPSKITMFFLPDWIKTLFKIAPKKGISYVHFFGAGEKISESETEYHNIKFKTSIVSQLNEKGQFKISVRPDQKNILGLWLRSDGDESKAEFTTKINALNITQD